MKLLFALTLIFVASAQVLAAPAKKHVARGGNRSITYCGALMLNCDRNGYTSELWFDTSDHSIAVSADVCQAAASAQDQCMCMDAAVQETHGMSNGIATVGGYLVQGSPLRACGAGSAAQRKVTSDEAAYQQAKAWCEGTSNVRPRPSKAISTCNCVEGFFMCR